MPSPIGHSLLAFTVAGCDARMGSSRLWWWLLILTAAVAPDFDFLPGILIGDPNRFHHGPSHSITGALLFALMVWLVVKPVGRREALILFLVYLSHLVADMLAADHGAPYGIPLFWPLIDDYFISPTPLFSNFSHGGRGEGLAGVLVDIFSMPNLRAVAIEVLILGPLLWLVQRLRRRRLSGHP
ncbi:MAG: metal-dependent hydrolase [Gammaproteobacteria bacterium]